MYVLRFIFLFSLFAYSFVSAEQTTTDMQQIYHGLPGCDCFLHCTCRSPTAQNHPKNDHDVLWHAFIKEVDEINRRGCAHSAFPLPRFYNLEAILKYFQYTTPNDCALLADYLNNCEKLLDIIEEKRRYCIDIAEYDRKTFPYSTKTRSAEEDIHTFNCMANELIEKVHQLKAKILRQYRYVLRGCIHDENPNNLAYIYNNSLLHFEDSDYINSLDGIKNFIQFCKSNSRTDLLTSGVYRMKGKLSFEVGLYDSAIKALSKAIDKDPENKEAYFIRAQAYFEKGEFDLAIQDYLTSDAEKTISTVTSKASLEFELALLAGLYDGAGESLSDFFPSLCSTAKGLGSAMWTFVQHPVISMKNFSNACYDMAEASAQFVKTVDQEKLAEVCDELRKLSENFGNLNDHEKGKLIGQAIGKYGVDIFAGGAVVKSALLAKYALTARKVKEANTLCNLEVMAASHANKEAMIASTTEHATARSNYFKSVKIEVDKQNKHVVGSHNYDPALNKSPFEHPNPQELLDTFAGKGKQVGNIYPPCTPGYQEIVDFGTFIGYDMNQHTGVKTATTWGKIHYSKKGAHIVPYLPPNMPKGK